MPHYITEEGLKALEEELKDIQEIQLPQILVSIESALKDGDVRENSPLVAARDRRDELLLRAGQIESILTDYQIISKTDSSMVRIGSTVTIKFLSNNMEATYRIVGSSETNPSNGLISDESPLGAAVIGRKLDNKVKYKAPSGEIEVQITKIE